MPQGGLAPRLREALSARRNPTTFPDAETDEAGYADADPPYELKASWSLSTEQNRPLTDAERELARWMLEHGTEEAAQYLDQLELAEVTPWKCLCGCASINFQIRGHAEPPPGVRILGDFLINPGDHPSGIFIFSSGGLLSGIEVTGLAGDAPTVLPRPENLSPFEPGNP